VSADLAVPGAGLEATVMCRNMMGGPTVIAADAKRNYEVIFGGKGDPQGEDIQPIPDFLLRTPQFRKAIRQGILEVVEGEDNPIVQSALARQTSAFHNRMRADELRAREYIDQATDDDMIAVLCIGPGTRPGTECGNQIPVRVREQGSRPPLCDSHQHLAERCVKRGSSPWVLEDIG
jgi:hypothetical protein